MVRAKQNLKHVKWNRQDLCLAVQSPLENVKIHKISNEICKNRGKNNSPDCFRWQEPINKTDHLWPIILQYFYDVVLINISLQNFSIGFNRNGFNIFGIVFIGIDIFF